MEQFKVIALLYIFLLLIVLGFALAATLVFPESVRYAFATAISVHSIVMLMAFWKYMTDEPKGKPNESD